MSVFRTYTTLGRCLAALPEPVALGVANLVGDVLFHVRTDQRDMVSANLRRVLGADAGDRATLDRWAHRSFRAYARYWVEGARLATTPKRSGAKTFVQGLRYLVEGIAPGKGVIMALPHVGSWEYGGAFLAPQGLPMTSVAERSEPPELFDFFVEQRAAIGLTIVPLGPASGSIIISTLRQGGLVGLMCDRDMGAQVWRWSSSARPRPCRPDRPRWPSGPAARLVTGASTAAPASSIRAVVEPPLDTTRQGTLRADVARLTQEIATRFEGLIRRAPDQWHVFQPFGRPTVPPRPRR